MSNGKVMIIHSMISLIYKMSQYFPKQYKLFGGYINVKVDFFNYATKFDFKKMQQELLHLN